MISNAKSKSCSNYYGQLDSPYLTVNSNGSASALLTLSALSLCRCRVDGRVCVCVVTRGRNKRQRHRRRRQGLIDDTLTGKDDGYSVPPPPLSLSLSQQNSMLVYLPEWYTKLLNLSLSFSAKRCVCLCVRAIYQTSKSLSLSVILLPLHPSLSLSLPPCLSSISPSVFISLVLSQYKSSSLFLLSLPLFCLSLLNHHSPLSLHLFLLPLSLSFFHFILISLLLSLSYPVSVSICLLLFVSLFLLFLSRLLSLIQWTFLLSWGPLHTFKIYTALPVCWYWNCYQWYLVQKQICWIHWYRQQVLVMIQYIIIIDNDLYCLINKWVVKKGCKKNHLISPGCPRPSIAFQCRIMV